MRQKDWLEQRRRMATALLDWLEETVLPADDVSKIAPFEFVEATWSVKVLPTQDAVEAVLGNVRIPEISKRWKLLKEKAMASVD